MADALTGLKCTVNRDGDLWMDEEARAFIHQNCVILKKTKTGLTMVALESDLKQVYSAPQKNINLRLKDILTTINAG
jgi:hypothetical protein